ncbi:MAG: hypothetical protein H0V82_01705 [Candidatus Protochlamydia sp.]|nr:hypothetical protein [Candidatus Protochlamydia sp.]
MLSNKNLIHHCQKTYYSPNYFCSLPKEILNTIFLFLNFNSLYDLYQSNSQLKTELSKNKRYIHLIKNKKFAKKIIAEFKPKINIVKFHENYDIAAADSLIAETEKAKKLCEGFLTVYFDKEIFVRIFYHSGSLEIPLKNLNVQNSDIYSYYKCRFTNRIEIFSNDKTIEKAIKIAQAEIKVLLEANTKYAQNLRI